jgi:hypothetical protein
MKLARGGGHGTFRFFEVDPLIYTDLAIFDNTYRLY